MCASIRPSELSTILENVKRNTSGMNEGRGKRRVGEGGHRMTRNSTYPLLVCVLATLQADPATLAFCSTHRWRGTTIAHRTLSCPLSAEDRVGQSCFGHRGLGLCVQNRGVAVSRECGAQMCAATRGGVCGGRELPQRPGSGRRFRSTLPTKMGNGQDADAPGCSRSGCVRVGLWAEGISRELRASSVALHPASPLPGRAHLDARGRVQLLTSSGGWLQQCGGGGYGVALLATRSMARVRRELQPPPRSRLRRRQHLRAPLRPHPLLSR